MLDNIDVAILTKLNDLSERYGLKAYDFIATVQPDPDNGKTMLCFEVPAQGNMLKEERFDKMLKAIGVDEDGNLKGTPTHVIDALEDAIHIAPKTHPRF